MELYRRLVQEASTPKVVSLFADDSSYDLSSLFKEVEPSGSALDAQTAKTIVIEDESEEEDEDSHMASILYSTTRKSDGRKKAKAVRPRTDEESDEEQEKEKERETDRDKGRRHRKDALAREADSFSFLRSSPVPSRSPLHYLDETSDDDWELSAISEDADIIDLGLKRYATSYTMRYRSLYSLAY